MLVGIVHVTCLHNVWYKQQVNYPILCAACWHIANLLLCISSNLKHMQQNQIEVPSLAADASHEHEREGGLGGMRGGG